MYENAQIFKIYQSRILKKVVGYYLLSDGSQHIPVFEVIAHFSQELPSQLSVNHTVIE